MGPRPTARELAGETGPSWCPLTCAFSPHGAGPRTRRTTEKRSANGESLAADSEAGHPIATNACSFKEERDGMPEHGRRPEKETQPARLSQAPHKRVCLRFLGLGRTRLGELLFPIIGGQSNRHGWSVSVSDRL